MRLRSSMRAVKAYLELMRRVIDHGHEKTDRTGTGTRSVFGHQLRISLRDSFPLLTTKKLHLKSIIALKSEGGHKNYVLRRNLRGQ